MMKAYKFKPNKINEEGFIDESAVATIEPCEKYLIIYFKDGTYKKVDKITFE